MQYICLQHLCEKLLSSQSQTESRTIVTWHRTWLRLLSHMKNFVYFSPIKTMKFVLWWKITKFNGSSSRLFFLHLDSVLCHYFFTPFIYTKIKIRSFCFLTPSNPKKIHKADDENIENICTVLTELSIHQKVLPYQFVRFCFLCFTTFLGSGLNLGIGPLSWEQYNCM